MIDLIPIAQALNQNKSNRRPKSPKNSKFTRHEYETIALSPTTTDMVNVINNNPNLCNRLAAQVLMYKANHRMTQSNIKAHAKRLVDSGAKFNVSRAVRIVSRSIMEGTQLY